MKIDRSNYEIWLIDWLDGNLSDLKAEELKTFLNENPELREEFDELVKINLKPSEKTFPHKNQLKKSPADLPLAQFEYLCVAYLENDLSVAQQTELKEIIDLDPEKKRSFELIQKTKLAPACDGYKHKNQLIKKTPAQRIIRLSVIGLSAAATVALLIISYLLIPRSLQDQSRNGMHSVSTLNTVIDSSKDGMHSVSTKPSVNKITVNKIVNPGQKREFLVAEVQKKTTVFPKSDSSIININDTLLRIAETRERELTKIPVFAQIDLGAGIISNTLIASNSAFAIPYYDEERSNIGRFIAKNFREIFLKEKSSSDSPLKGYEIAEAGVTGLNKLLGWEMALDKNNDANGELQSVYFSSKMLKFNTPVKKTEPLP